MTVRFSDIFRRGTQENKRPNSSQQNIHINKVEKADFKLMSMEETPGFSDLLISDRYSLKVKAYYKHLLEKAKEIRDHVKQDKVITADPTPSLIQGIIDDGLIEQLYEYAVYIHIEKGLPSHAVSVTLASMKVGRGLGYDAELLLHLGLAAFFENVGMYKIPEHILKKKGELSAEETNKIRKQPEMSELIILQMGPSFEWLAETALQVRERSDGSGYPKGLKGDEISEPASIIGLIDTYIAMIMSRPYRKKHTQTGAVKSIIESGKKKFPPRVLKGFLDQISLYPVNTYVRLNNRAVGVVRSTDRNQLLKPTIELLYDGLDRKLESHKVIHLSNYPLLHIVDTIDEEELN